MKVEEHRKLTTDAKHLFVLLLLYVEGNKLFYLHVYSFLLIYICRQSTV